MISKKIVSFWSIFLLYTLVYPQTDSITYFKRELITKKTAHSFSAKDTSYINLLNKLAFKYKHIKTDTIVILAREALELSKSIDYEMGILEALSNLAVYNLNKGNVEESLAQNEQILGKLNIKKFPTLGANVYNVLAETYFRLGNYPEAYKHGRQSLLLAEQANNIELIRKFNSNLGTLFSFLEDYDEALKFYEIALYSFDKNEEDYTKGGILLNLAYLYMEKKDYDKALKLLDQSTPIVKKADIPEMLTAIYLAYGRVYFHYNDFDKALMYFELANINNESYNNNMNKALSFYRLGTASLALNRLKNAEEYLSLSLDLYKKLNSKTGLQETYNALYQLSKKQKITNKSLYFLELSQQYADSNYVEKNIRDIAMFKAKLDFEENKKVLKLNAEKEVLKQKKKVKWAGLGFTITFVIAILVFSINKIEKNLNKELALQSLNLSKKQAELHTIKTNQDKLFSIVGHDLRGPIVSLKQLLGLALEDESGVQHFYTFGPKLKQDVDHIHFTLDNLLNWGKTQMHGDPLHPVKISVNEELLAIKNLFRVVIHKKSITIHKELLDGITVIADDNHFKIIFRNLISNALKFTQENGSIWLTSIKEKDTIVLSVRDNGIGMSEEVVDKIFNQSDYYTTFGTNNERGTGLGLRLCQEMVLKNNGEIWVHSSLGKGSTFYIRFPMAPAT